MPLSRRARVLIGVAVALLLVPVAVIAFLVLRFQPVARDYVISALRDRYQSDVRLGELNVSLFPSVRVTGRDLELRFTGRGDLPPMIRARQFIVDASFIGFFRSPKRISLIRLDGLVIQVPPRSPSEKKDAQNKTAERFPFVLEEVIADSALLKTLPSDPAKDPLVFQIRELTMHSVGIAQPMTFHARVENPKPRGLIHTDGQFGPWNARRPSDTPLSGNYTFRDADLGVFKGISGTLSSDGSYRGQLANLEVHGTTEVPEFALDTAGNSQHLHTDFDATVDGTNGNTVLHPVRAQLGRAVFEVSGAIARGALETGKTIDLDAMAESTNLEDFLRLTVKGPKSPMTGRIGFRTKVKIPSGDSSVADRLQLDGTFRIGGVRFTSPDVQEKIAGLSHRAQGDPDDHGANVTADFSGVFHLRNGRLALPQLQFELPGAHVTLAGGYALRSGAIDFEGTARLDATVSQMTTGIKRVLLKPIDPLFRRDGAGTVVPIRISGTRGEPAFTIDIGRILKRK